MVNNLPAARVATFVAKRAIGDKNFENAKKEAERMAKEKANELKEKAKKMAEQKANELKEEAMKKAKARLEKTGGGRKNRKKTLKKRFRKKNKSP
jgi:hypothetical protein